jgi:signal transduction histidine kinase
LKPLHEKAHAMAAQIDATIQTVRRISTELRPGVLDDLGLAAAIEWQANEFQTRTGIRCEVDVGSQEKAYSPEINTAVFRIFQETLTNIVRHAKAAAVQVRFVPEADRVLLEVKDNGCGISETAITSPRSIGLAGMRERAALLGGALLIQGVRGEGTTVTVRIPLPRPEPNHPGNHENSHSRRSRSRAARPEADSCG